MFKTFKMLAVPNYSVSRRGFLKGLGLGAAAGALGGAACLNFTTEDLELTTTRVRVPELPSEFEGYRIAFLTDLHLGVCIPDEWLEQAVNMAAASDPDMILLGGDLIWLPDSFANFSWVKYRNPRFENEKDPDRAMKVFETVSNIVAARTPADGIFSVYGNHDRWISSKLCAQSYAKSGITLLNNEFRSVKRGAASLMIYGSDDYWTGIPKLNLPSREPREVRLLLSHNPDYVSDSLYSKNYDFDLALCGHTHGGQIKLPAIGYLIKNVRDATFHEGLVQTAKGAVYTSRGLGVVGLPFRINCRPEVSVITLTQA